MYGHTDTVTCLVASEAHSVIISGSLDQTCILWDLEDLSYITQLPEHSSAVSALAINDLTVSTLQKKHTRSEVSLHFSAPKSLSIHLTPAHLIWFGPFGSCCCLDDTFIPVHLQPQSGFWNSPQPAVLRKGGHILPFRPALMLKPPVTPRETYLQLKTQEKRIYIYNYKPPSNNLYYGLLKCPKVFWSTVNIKLVSMKWIENAF